MKSRFLTTLFLIFHLHSLGQTRLIILGTVHDSTRNFTSDSIFYILKKTKPDLILLELDSSFFTSEFKLKTKPNINETIGAVKYISIYPTLIRPYEIEGRNEYYQKTNYFERERDSYAKLRTLKLSKAHKRVWKEFSKLNNDLRVIGQKSPFEINQLNVYKITERRQEIKHDEILQIFNEREELAEYKDFYKEMGDFWKLRNTAMANNILKHLKGEEFQNKTIIVLTGFYHKYFLLKELTPKQNDFNFIIREYYELK